MKILRSVLLVCMMLFPAVASADELGLMRISFIQGDVQVAGPDLEDWIGASVNLPLAEGDRIWVPDGGRVEAQIRGGVFVRADERTALDVLSLGDDSIQFYLDQGHAYLNNNRGGVKTAQVDTALASVRIFDNSIMMIDVTDGGATEVSVLKGHAYAESRAGTTRVTAGSTLTISDEYTAELSPIGPTDEWDRWNLDRDRELVAWGESARYLPSELHEYSPDLDAHGRWAYTGEYGYVWTPTVVAADWAPYAHGSWAWVRGNYVWVSFDPWGWAPFHYGRWVYITGFGWSWVPPAAGAVYWGPGYVGWIVTPQYVAWVPLAPGEIYYGYGYFGPASVNITTVNVNTIVVKERFRNVTARNSVTVVERKTFGTGRRDPVRLKENPFLVRKQEVEIIPPRVRPEKRLGVVTPPMRELERRKQPERIPETRPEGFQKRKQMPEVRRETVPQRPVVRPFQSNIPEHRQPPDRVKKIQPEQLKSERRLTRERDASVFRQERPEQMPVQQKQEPKVIMRKQAPAGSVQPPQPQKKGRPEKRDRDEDREQRRQRGR